MKRIVPALALGMLLSGGCTDSRSDLVVQGVVAPEDGTCTFKPATDSSVFEETKFFYPRVQALVSGSLSQYVGFQVLNTVTSGQTIDTAGSATDSTHRDDIVLNGVDITITDLTGSSIASESVLAGGYVPGAGGQDVTIPDIMGKPLADAVRGKMTFPAVPKNETLILQVQVSGKSVSGQSLESAPFNYPVELHFDDPFAVAVGNVTQTVALLADGGHADEVIQADGTAVLGNATALGDGGADVVQQFSTAFSDAQIAAAQAALSDPDGGASGVLAAVNPCL
jgi:hypothetical protein